MMAKVQPIDTEGMATAAASSDHAKPPATKSRLKRLFERQFPGVIRSSSSAEKLASADLEPSSICLDKMVRNFMEDAAVEKASRCGRNRCNCFNGNDSSSDAEDDYADVAVVTGEAPDSIKSLVVCSTVIERNLLADVSGLVDKVKNNKRKDECRKAVADGLRSIGYDASLCKSRWEVTPSIPAGEYEYIDVIVAGGERLVVDVEFRSEFEIARSTKSYRAVLQCLPCVFVGRADRLSQIVGLATEAARLSLKKKGLHFPPWRKPEYMRAKWLSPYTRSIPAAPSEVKLVELECEKVGSAEPKPAKAELKPIEVKPKLGSSGAKVVTGFTLSP